MLKTVLTLKLRTEWEQLTHLETDGPSGHPYSDLGTVCYGLSSGLDVNVCISECHDTNVQVMGCADILIKDHSKCVDRASSFLNIRQHCML